MKLHFRVIIFLFSLTIFSSIVFQNCSQSKFKSVTEGGVEPTQFSELNNFSELNKSAIEVKSKSELTLRTGQIIGFSIGFSALITLGSGSFFDHVGIIGIDKKTMKPFVYNSDYNGWLKYDLETSFAGIPYAIVEDPQIKNDKLKQDEIYNTLETLVKGGSDRYDFASFYPTINELENSFRKGCSHFVAYAFSQLGLPNSTVFGYGLIQQVRDLGNFSNISTLDTVNSASDFLIKKYLSESGGHPIRSDFSSTPWPSDRIAKVKDFYVITPDSIMNDSRLEIVYSSVPMGGRYFSEREIYFSMKDRFNFKAKAELQSLGSQINSLSTTARNTYPTNLRRTTYLPKDWVWNKESYTNNPILSTSHLNISCPSTSTSGSSVSCSATGSGLVSGNWYVNDSLNLNCKNKIICTWDNVPAGTYTIKSVGIDLNGVSVFSNSQVITIMSNISTGPSTTPSASPKIMLSCPTSSQIGSTLKCTTNIVPIDAGKPYWIVNNQRYAPCDGQLSCSGPINSNETLKIQTILVDTKGSELAKSEISTVVFTSPSSSHGTEVTMSSSSPDDSKTSGTKLVINCPNSVMKGFPLQCTTSVEMSPSTKDIKNRSWFLNGSKWVSCENKSYCQFPSDAVGLLKIESSLTVNSTISVKTSPFNVSITSDPSTIKTSISLDCPTQISVGADLNCNTFITPAPSSNSYNVYWFANNERFAPCDGKLTCSGKINIASTLNIQTVLTTLSGSEVARSNFRTVSVLEAISLSCVSTNVKVGEKVSCTAQLVPGTSGSIYWLVNNSRYKACDSLGSCSGAFDKVSSPSVQAVLTTFDGKTELSRSRTITINVK